MLRTRHFLLAAAVFVGGAHGISAQTPAKQQSSRSANHALDRANLDTTCAACDDFYTFANGGWLKTAKIPPSYPSYGSFEALYDRNEAILHGILDTASRDLHGLPDRQPATGTNAFRVAAYYDACMDTTQIEKLGTTPVSTGLRRIASISSRTDLVAAIAQLEQSDGLAPYGISPGPDAKNSDQIIANAGQGGLNLPDRDYYLKPEHQKVRDAYVAHVERMFVLLGDAPTDAKAHAQTVLAMETKFAEASMDRVTMRDPKAVYHMMTLVAFDSITPNLNWKGFLATQKAPPITTLNVAQPEFFKAMNGFVGAMPVEDWKTLLRWRLVHTRARFMPNRFVTENFNFNKTLTGQQEQLARWKKCTSNTDGALGEALGQEYVQRTFTPAAKARARAIVDNMVAVLGDQIGQLEWMGPDTKKEALVKLQSFKRKIGYPDKWIDYSALTIATGQYLEDQRRVEQFSNAREWKKVGKPVDKSEWGMSPPTVNAYYNPSWNEIVFPAGILLPPFFDPNADDAVNYGAMGAVIGHEMTHGFDDQGRQFDSKGNLRDWWTADDAAKYNAEAKKVVDQFDAYTIVDTATHVNGKLTLGENIADLGGLKVAYIALQRSLTKTGRPGPIDGFTPEQRFFLGWAQVWRTLQRDESAKVQVASDEHSPAIWRVNGPLSNMTEFKTAWGCKAGDRMVRPDALKARIW
jgi:putative endopeptidase